MRSSKTIQLHSRDCRRNRVSAAGPRHLAFTLVEVLVVIAITVILFGLLIRPVIDTLRYTKDAQLQAAAQDSARKTMEILSREIGSAAYVSDNASHAFDGSSVSTYAGVQSAQFSNFLNVAIPTSDPTTSTFAHIYNAKLDVIMARHVDSKNGLTDPTAGNEPVQLQSTSLAGGSGTSYLTATKLMFPLAPGTSMIRYFIGLQNPDKPYSNVRDHVGTTTNTYVLYRAQFNPYDKNQDGSFKLFASDATGQPILDDPDFFRPVLDGDVDWIDPASGARATYGTPSAAATSLGYKYLDTTHHNDRYDAWKQIAKPIITAPEIDMLEMPHNSNRTLNYDATGGMFPGVAHYGADHDPVGGKDYPMERTSVTFLPGTISADVAPSTTSSYQSRGIAGGTSGATNGLPYIPTVYQSVGQSWARPYSVDLYPMTGTGINTGAQHYYEISQAITSLPDTTNPGTNLINAGDIVEYYVSTASGNRDPLYNLTQGQIVTTSYTDIIPASVNEDYGTVNFDVPAVPGQTGNLISAASYDKFQRQWTYSQTVQGAKSTTAAAPGKNAFISPNVIDLTQTDDNGNIPPLNNQPKATNYKLDYAFLVPGSIRLYGPDMYPGANYGKPTVYTEVSANSAPGPNQFTVDYFKSTITLQSPPSNSSTNASQPWPGPFNIIYDYQANMRPSNGANPIVVGTNEANPLAIKVTYHSRQTLTVTVGVRYIDSTGNSQNVVLSNAVKVGNINR